MEADEDVCPGDQAWFRPTGSRHQRKNQLTWIPSLGIICIWLLILGATKTPFEKKNQQICVLSIWLQCTMCTLLAPHSGALVCEWFRSLSGKPLLCHRYSPPLPQNSDKARHIAPLPHMFPNVPRWSQMFLDVPRCFCSKMVQDSQYQPNITI